MYADFHAALKISSEEESQGSQFWQKGIKNQSKISGEELNLTGALSISKPVVEVSGDFGRLTSFINI